MAHHITTRRRSADPERRAAHLAARQITLRPMSSLATYGQNARQHSATQLDLIARSIREFGFVNPLLIDEHGMIVAGHGRYEAARRLGLEVVPTIELKRLTPGQVKAYRLADNRIAELSSWDDGILRLEILEFADLDASGALEFDLTLTGFETPSSISSSPAPETRQRRLSSLVICRIAACAPAAASAMYGFLDRIGFSAGTQSRPRATPRFSRRSA